MFFDLNRAATVLLASCAFLLGVTQLHAQTTLPDFVVSGDRVANQVSAGTIDMPVSALRFEPRVDVQARNLAEAQADIAIRGGIFEATGFRIGAAALGDPQTGHYFAELPIAPQMLQAPQVVTGLEHAAAGFNAGAGTIAFGFRPIVSRGSLGAAFGDFRYQRQSAYLAHVEKESGLAADIEASQSRSDGSVPGGDHDFSRLAARVQLQRPNAQTDFFVGYQHKFFGWPNLYTPFGFQESENLQTVLALLNHHWSDRAGNEFDGAILYRRNKDDYEFNRAVPGASNPFLHTTWMRGAAVAGRVSLSESSGLRYSADLMRDRLESTALTFGRFSERSILKLAAVPERTWHWQSGSLKARAGASFDDSDRDASAWSPLFGAEWRTSRGMTYLEYSESTQLPTYTALNSSATSGLFRGNASLGRMTAANLEWGARAPVGAWTLEVAVFRRNDEDLVDWTFRHGVVARTANAVDIRTTGVELVAAHRTARHELVFGYTWLEKKGDYGSALVDASFYALNFPRHRFTLAATVRLGGGFEVRSDNEYRVQEDNPLRLVGGDTAWLSSLGLYFTPPWARAWEVSLLVDNLWSSDFQEVPAVPAARRQWTMGATWRW